MVSNQHAHNDGLATRIERATQRSSSSDLAVACHEKGLAAARRDFLRRGDSGSVKVGCRMVVHKRRGVSTEVDSISLLNPHPSHSPIFSYTVTSLEVAIRAAENLADLPMNDGKNKYQKLKNKNK